MKEASEFSYAGRVNRRKNTLKKTKTQIHKKRKKEE